MVRDRLQEMQVISMKRNSRDDDAEDGGSKKEDDTLLSKEHWNQVEEFLNRVSNCRQLLDRMNGDLKTIKGYHSKVLLSPSSDPTTMEKINNLADAFKQASQAVRNDIKIMQGEVARFEAEGDGDKEKKLKMSVNARIHESQVNALTKELQTVVGAFRDAQLDHKEKLKKKVTDSVKIRGLELSESDMEEVMETGDLSGKAKGLLLATKEKAELFEDVKSRHDELLKLEISIRELAEMFLDLNGLVTSQGELINNIEFNVQNAVEYAEKAKSNVDAAKKLQASARKKKMLICIFIVILIIILILFLQGLVCHFTPIC